MKKHYQKAYLKHGNQGYVEDQREFFHCLTNEDREIYLDPTWQYWARHTIEQTCKIIKNIKSVIDVGCGDGYRDFIFAQQPGIEKVIGFDNTPACVEQANKYYPHPKIQRFCADIRDDDLAQKFGTVDLVSSFNVIEHLKDPTAFIKNCSKLIKKEGYLVLETPNKNRLQNRLLNILQRKQSLSDPLHYKEYDFQDIKEMATQLKLTPIECFGYGFSLTVKGITILKAPSSVSMRLGKFLPKISSTICIVLKKSDFL